MKLNQFLEHLSLVNLVKRQLTEDLDPLLSCLQRKDNEEELNTLKSFDEKKLNTLLS